MNTTTRHRGRVALAVMATGAIAAAIAGCSAGGDSAGSGGTSTITLGIQTETNDNKPYAAVVAAFEEANPDVKVEIEETPLDSYANVLKTQLQGGGGPDVFYGSPGTGNANALLSLADQGLVLDITGESWAEEAVPENAQSLFYLDDALYAIPVDLVPVGVVANETGYEELSLSYPATIDEILDNCPTTAAADKSFWILPAATPPANALLALNIASGLVYAENPEWNSDRAAGDTTFADSAGWQETLDLIVEMNEKGCFQEGATGMTNETSFPLLAQGLALNAAAPGSAALEFGQLNPDITWAVHPFPGPTEDDTRAYASPSNGLAINANTDGADASRALLEFFASEEGQNLFAEKNGTVSLATSSDSPLPDEYAPLQPYLADEAKFFPLANLDWPNGDVFTALGEGVQGLLTGQATVDDVLANMDSAWG